eukprot:COSAG06_NODE_12486_length_1375_cov_1.344044_2_plen_156_part_00
MAPQWAVGMTEQPYGSFKLSLLDDEPISSSPTSRSSLLAEPSAAASPLQEPPLPPPQQRLMIGLAAVGAFALTVILNHVSSLQPKLPSTAGYQEVQQQQNVSATVFKCGASTELSFDATGSISHLVRDGTTWADIEHTLFQLKSASPPPPCPGRH